MTDFDPNEDRRRLQQAPVQPAPMPVMQQAPVQTEDSGMGIVDFFKSLFNRQNPQDGLRNNAQPYAPATGGIRG